MTTTSTPEVWDLADDTAHPTSLVRGPEPARPDLGGAAAAGAGLLALGAAVVPGVPEPIRWCLLVGLGVVAVLVGAAALLRRQILLTALLAAAGMAAALLAAVAVVVLPSPAPPVSDSVLPTGSPFTTSAIVRVSPELHRRAGQDEATARAAVAGLARHLRAMHGAAGPFPAELDGTRNAVVERGGTIDDVLIGAIPDGMHVRYSVAPDRRYFQLRVELDADPAAAATADSTIAAPAQS